MHRYITRYWVDALDYGRAWAYHVESGNKRSARRQLALMRKSVRMAPQGKESLLRDRAWRHNLMERKAKREQQQQPRLEPSKAHLGMLMTLAAFGGVDLG